MRVRRGSPANVCAAVALAVVFLAMPVCAQEIPPVLGHDARSPAPQQTAGNTELPAVTPPAPPAAVEGMIERGAYLVRLGGCNDCHTPLQQGPNGPEPDMSRMLSGHPADLKMPPPPKLPAGPWLTLAAATNTAFAGPWGVSYGSNLTPDEVTGIGTWTEETFVDTMRSGRHFGVARPILPPMPWQNLARLNDDDLRSVYRYLKSIPAIANHVPEAEVAARPPPPVK